MFTLTIVFYDATHMKTHASSYHYDDTFLWVIVPEDFGEKTLAFSTRLIASLVITKSHVTDEKDR